MSAVHEKSARPSHIAHHINQVRFPHDDCVSGEDGNIAVRIVGYIAGERDDVRLIGLIAMRNRDASASLFRESTRGGDEIEKPLLSRHGIHSRPGYFA